MRPSICCQWPYLFGHLEGRRKFARHQADVGLSLDFESTSGEAQCLPVWFRREQVVCTGSLTQGLSRESALPEASGLVYSRGRHNRNTGRTANSRKFRNTSVRLFT
ncbi:hypothetical protein NP493_238g01037 [Ridgeia piscesae]|uniref:Uncharacterized protein n=1 Tax=Ridgeia piscesae TaxID=27915 RepID=A0AAD9NZS0_RIDPI|nr:hypothetical protein NP493_238g01037 [Ridgeia piscesae]